MLEEPAAYIGEVLQRVKKVYIQRTYGIKSWYTARLLVIYRASLIGLSLLCSYVFHTPNGTMMALVNDEFYEHICFGLCVRTRSLDFLEQFARKSGKLLKVDQ